MFDSLLSKKMLVTGMLSLLLLSRMHGQNPEKIIYKKYTLTDTLATFKSAELIFFADSTFINFGIFDDKTQMDLFVWYKAGTWNPGGTEIECQVNEKKLKDDELKKLVKFYYRRHPDKVLITNYYEFVHEAYTNGTLLVSKEKASDSEKKISYYETNLNIPIK